MGESCRFAHFFCIETEHRLVNVPFKVSLGNKVVRAEDDTLEVSPKALNAVGLIGTDGEFTLSVTDEDMVVFLAKSFIGGQFVSNNGAALCNKMFNDRD